MFSYTKTLAELRNNLIKEITNNLDRVNQKLKEQNEGNFFYAQYEDECYPLLIRTEPIVCESIVNNENGVFALAYVAYEGVVEDDMPLNYDIKMLTTESLIKLVE